MKKTFFMVGILAALSMTAFGEEVGSVTKEIKIKGTAVKGITITPTEDAIEFGRVLVNSEAISQEIGLNLTGESGQNVVLNSTMIGDGMMQLK